MSKFLIKKLNMKYNYNTFFLSKSLQIGSLININLLKGNFRSNFFGILIKRKSIGASWSITLRNVMKKYAIERTFNLNGKQILNIHLLKNKLNKFSSRYNLFYLRNISKIHSTIKI